MKKLLIIPAVAIVAAAGAASASQLVFNDTATMQAGQTTDLSCADSAQVVGWGYEHDDASVSSVRIALDEQGEQCVGAEMFVTVLDEAGASLVGTTPVDITSVQDSYSVKFKTPVSAEKLGGVRVAIEG